MESMIKAILLGILQGVTEFLPVSSSGHLIIAQYFLGYEEIPLLFDIILHVATLIAVCVIFRKRITSMFLSSIRFVSGRKNDGDGEDLLLVKMILIATLFTGVVGIVIKKMDIDSPRVISALFIVTGLILILSKFFHGKIGYEKIKVRHGIITGIAQGLGVLPGISRSGITITASVASGLKRENAGEYSFLISIPAIFGALLLDIKQAGNVLVFFNLLELGAAFLAAFATGIISLFLLLKLVKRGKLYFFSFYLIPAGIFGLFFLQ